MEGITNSIKIGSTSGIDMSPDGDFFRVWVEFLKPVHNLTNREMDVLAAFLKKRYEMGKVITDIDSLDKMLMYEETKKEVRLSCGITPKHFQVIMSKFRKNGVIKDGRIHLKLVPSILNGGAGLVIYFDFSHGRSN